MTTLRHFLNARRADGTDWNITGMPHSPDFGKYKIADEEYDTFLSIAHSHTFGHPPNNNALLEKHKEHGPILIDADLRYDLGQPLRRRFTHETVRTFVSHYIAAMIYFAKVEDLPADLQFYYLIKPSAESDAKSHKDGIHLHCPSISTTPKFQYGIRGYLLQQGILPTLFSDATNPPEDIFDVSVIHRNNWFLYGACKPSKAQYAVERIWRLSITDLREALDGGDPLDVSELAEKVSEWLTEDDIPRDTLSLIRTLSIRRGYDTNTGPALRPLRQPEWEELMIAWGSGKGKIDRGGPAPPTRNTVEWNAERLPAVDLSGASMSGGSSSSSGGSGAEVIFGDGLSIAEQEIALAYRLARECINPERRAGPYHDWVNFAFLLKNISDSDESFAVWMDVSHNATDLAGKPPMAEADLRRKWDSLRSSSSDKKLTIRSLMHWANEDNPMKLRNVLSKSLQTWILQRAENTHVGIAEIVHNVYRYEFASSLQGKKGNYEWFHYAGGTHAWKMMKQPIELRASLSGRIRNEFSKAIRAIREQHESMNDDMTAINNIKETEDITTEVDKLVASMGWKREQALEAVMKTHRENAKSKAKTKAAETKKPSDLDDKRKTLQKIETNLQTTGFKDCVLKECGEMFYDNDFLSKLNCNPYLVGVSNGVLDLHYTERDPVTNAMKPTRVQFRPGVPEDSISFQMGRMEPDLDAIPYIPWSEVDDSVKAELNAFFARIYPDPVLCKYVLTLLASCLEGQNKEQKFYVNQGEGSNGKSMIQNLMEYVFGDYQTSLQTTVLTRKRPESGAANPDMITVKCRRYIYMGEPDPGEKLNTSRMKQFSGDDRIEARPLFGDQEKFNMMGKLFLSCNEKPEISSMDNGTWRRIRVIPHVSTFKDPGDPAIDESKHIYPKDLMLKHKLREWRVAFLSMLVFYYETEYLPYGLKEPAVVLEASNKYKEENDVFMKFFTESFVKEDGVEPLTDKLAIRQFREWKTNNRGIRIELKEAQIKDRLRQMGAPGSTDKLYLGLRLNTEGVDLSGSRFLSHD